MARRYPGRARKSADRPEVVSSPRHKIATEDDDVGADVVRVDRAQSVERGFDPGWMEVLNRGRRSIGVDLKQSDGVETVLRMVEHADALIEGFRPGVAERLGIGPDACRARNPKLVYGRMTGWGQDGPYAQAAGH